MGVGVIPGGEYPVLLLERGEGKLMGIEIADLI